MGGLVGRGGTGHRDDARCESLYDDGGVEGGGIGGVCEEGDGVGCVGLLRGVCFCKIRNRLYCTTALILRSIAGMELGLLLYLHRRTHHVFKNIESLFFLNK